MSDRIDWADTPAVYLQAQRCPRCGSKDYEYKRSDPRDAVTVRRLICRICGQPWRSFVCDDRDAFLAGTLPVTGKTTPETASE